MRSSRFTSARALSFVFLVAPALLINCGTSDTTKPREVASGGNTATGGNDSGGSTVSGGNGSGGSGASAGASTSGGSSAVAGTIGNAGSLGSSGSGTGGSTMRPPVAPGSYALGAPDQCKNQFYVAGCEDGKTTSTCGGVCTSRNACEDGKTGDPGFACPRYLLFADEMAQAAKDDAQYYNWSTNGRIALRIRGGGPRHG